MKRYWRERLLGPMDAIHPSTGRRVKVDPQQDVLITDISKDLLRLPALMSWYCGLRDHAETLFKEAKHCEHNVYEDVYAELRDAPIKKGEKRPNETEIKMAVKRDSRMRVAFRERMGAEAMLRNLRSAVTCVEAKKFALMSLAKREQREAYVPDSD